MKVLAFAASSSRNSINKALISYAAQLLEGGLVPSSEVEVLDINDYEMPLYSIDRENEGGIPDEAHRFFKKIGDADALLISYAEHNGSYTAAFKNLYDWTSRIDSKVYQGKPGILLATSTGRRGGIGVLNAAKMSAPYFGMVLKADLSIPKFRECFDFAEGRITDPEIRTSLEAALRSFND